MSDMNHNYRLDIAYRGTNYKGWQVQPDQPTIQGTLHDVVSSVIDTPFKIRGASRTDAGVHALHQVVSLKTSAKWTPDSLRNFLNAYLPEDISVLRVTKVHPKFNPRFGVKEKTYLYLVINTPIRNPIFHRLAWNVTRDLRIDLMMAGARLLSGYNDYRTFYKPEKGEKRQTILELSCEVIDLKPFIIFRLRAKFFLRYMVRKIVGALVNLGAGNLFLDDIQFMLEAKNPALGKYIAPPDGLYLAKIIYDWENEEEVGKFLRENIAFTPLREFIDLI